MRQGANNIIVKAFLGLLALSFVVWGVGDVFRGRTNDYIAIVDGEEISYNEYSNTLNREIAKYQQMLGGALTDEQIERFGVRQAVLRQIVDNKIISRRVNDLDIKVGDEAAQEKIIQANIFLDEEGNFDKEAFNAILRANGINKDEYIASLKSEAAVSLFLDTMAVTPVDISRIQNAIYGYRNEKRVVDVAYFPEDYIKDIASPTGSDLIQYYQDNTEKFAIPEIRSASYLTIGIDSVEDGLKISDSDAETYYENNKEMYAVEEQREVSQYLFNDAESAKKALEDLKKGESKKYKSELMELGKVTYTSLPEEIRDAVFSLEKGQHSEPVKTDLGFHIFYVSELFEPHDQPFNEVKKDIKKQIAKERATEIFFELANQIEDDFAAGKKIDEIAEKHSLVVHKVPAIDYNGNGAQGKPVQGLPDVEKLASLVFSTGEGMESPVTLLDDNTTYVVVHVDSISPARTKALDEVRGIAAAMWKEEQKSIQLAKAATEFSDKVKAGENFYKLADEYKVKVKKDKELRRPTSNDIMGGNDGLSPRLTTQVFGLKANESTEAYRNSDGSFSVATLKKVKKAKADDAKMSSLADDLSNDFTDDIMTQYNTYLRNQYPVTVNETLLNPKD